MLFKVPGAKSSLVFRGQWRDQHCSRAWIADDSLLSQPKPNLRVEATGGLRWLSWL